MTNPRLADAPLWKLGPFDDTPILTIHANLIHIFYEIPFKSLWIGL